MSLNSAIKSRLVRCPRCRLMLREPHNCMAYEISKSKGCKLLECQQRALALCFLVTGPGSVLLDMFGKNKLPFLLVAFLLSQSSSALTLYVCIKDRTRVKPEIKMMEIVFFLIQLVLTFLQFLLTILDVKNNFNASVHILGFAMIAVVFVLWKDKKVTDVPPVKPQTIDSKRSTSNQIDPEPLNSLTMRSNAGTDVEQADRQLNDLDIPSHNIEKENDNIDYCMSYITHIFNPTEEYVDMLPEEELDKQPETEKDKKNGGGGGGDDNNGDGDGGDDGNDGSSGGKNEKKDDSDGNGNGNNDKGEDSGCGGGNNGNMKRKQNKPMFGCKFGYHAGNENLCPIGQLQCV